MLVMSGQHGAYSVPMPLHAMTNAATAPAGLQQFMMQPFQVAGSGLRTHLPGAFVQGQQLHFGHGFVGRLPQHMGQVQMVMPAQMFPQSQWLQVQPQNGQGQVAQFALPHFSGPANTLQQGPAGSLPLPAGLQGGGDAHAIMLRTAAGKNVKTASSVEEAGPRIKRERPGRESSPLVKETAPATGTLAKTASGPYPTKASDAQVGNSRLSLLSA